MDISDECMDVLISLPPDFPYDELFELADLLERADVFVPGYLPPPCGTYNPDGFLYSRHVEQSGTVLLPDRNIVSRIVKVARSGVENEHDKLAAAILAYAQCVDMLIEPSISFHELAPHQGNI
ncbi:hypothetical protein SAMN02745857_03802 [Andreprevotia lacus DSM 23236]|jgi:hypothetical protein|uniref:Uncharacterized protein n=1 Tax=Andreprevotia lacus DSM 23236 TaxID=1121001 RepID=A0A1W1XZN9_9NEIS|nr:hypothetical protein [Andreprevotia lacus]SMC29386.1 hypothetical protein SAMN02745857_03802 [Andreprevotia lacus DSM 23236]